MFEVFTERCWQNLEHGLTDVACRFPGQPTLIHPLGPTYGLTFYAALSWHVGMTERLKAGRE